MSDEEIAVANDIKEYVVGLSETAKQAPQPVRAILSSQIFILLAKVKYLLGEKE